MGTSASLGVHFSQLWLNGGGFESRARRKLRLPMGTPHLPPSRAARFAPFALVVARTPLSHANAMGADDARAHGQCQQCSRRPIMRPRVRVAWPRIFVEQIPAYAIEHDGAILSCPPYCAAGSPRGSREVGGGQPSLVVDNIVASSQVTAS